MTATYVMASGTDDSYAAHMSPGTSENTDALDTRSRLNVRKGDGSTLRPIHLIMLCIIALSGCASPSNGVKVISPETVAQIKAEEVDSVARLSIEGKADYEADLLKSTGPQYCAAAVSFAYRGEFRRAIREAAKALFLGEMAGDQFVIGLAKRDIALTYSLAGKLKQAEQFIDEALSHFSFGSTHAVAFAFKIRGDIRLRTGRPDEAIADYEAALQRPARNYLVPSIKTSLANALFAKGNMAEAKTIFQEIRETATTDIRPLIDRGLANIALHEKRFQEATRLFERAAMEHRASSDSYHRIWALDGLARVMAENGDHQGAIKVLREAMVDAEKVRAIFRSEEFRAGFFGDIQRVFDRAILLLMGQARVEEALEVSERSRARALLDMLRDRVVSPYDPRAFAESQGRVYSNEELKKLIPPGIVLVEFHVLRHQTIAWTVRNSSIHAITIKVNQNHLSHLVRDYWGTIASRRPLSSQSGEKLFRLLVEPLKLRNDEVVIIVPHDSLHYLPFHALAGPRGYLVETLVISYAPSASALANLLEHEQLRKESIIAFGNPDLGIPKLDLPNSQTEVEFIKTIHPNAEVYTRRNATKAHLMSLAPSKNVVHIAAHASIDQIDPLHSVIHLARTQKGPGDLKAYEIYALNLRKVKLAALSACQTGFENTSRGDEIWGFTRTFLSSGARSLLVSLWPVEDRSTSELMSRFYEQWKDKSTTHALRSAQLALLHDEKTNHPFYWATFILVGDWR